MGLSVWVLVHVSVRMSLSPRGRVFVCGGSAWVCEGGGLHVCGWCGVARGLVRRPALPEPVGPWQVRSGPAWPGPTPAEEGGPSLAVVRMPGLSPCPPPQA